MKEIFGKAKNDDIDSFGVLIKQYEKLYYNIAYRISNNPEDAKDITQDSLIKIYKNLKRCFSYDLFKSWSCKIVTNTSLDFLRAKKRRFTESLDEKVDSSEGSFEKQIDSHVLSPEEEYIKDERAKLIKESIEELPDKHKTIIVLRDLNGLSYEEISEITESSLGTVKSRISRARKNLKDILIEKLELNNKGNVK